MLRPELRSVPWLVLLAWLPAQASEEGPRPYLPTVESFPRAPAADVGRIARVRGEGSLKDLPAYVQAVLPPGELRVGEDREISSVLAVDETRRWMAARVAQWFTQPDGHVAGMLVAETGDRGMPMCIVRVEAARSGARVGIHLELDPSCPRRIRGTPLSAR